MLNVKQFRYSIDNLAYVVYGKTEAIAVDPGASEAIFDFITHNNLFLKAIYNTHNHFDHLIGNDHLRDLSGISSTNPPPGGTRIEIGEEVLSIIKTPGHTKDSICIYSEDRFILTGDTLFIANVGNCNDSDMEIFHQSLQKLLSLPDRVVVYPGHDYTDRSIRRAREISPENSSIDEFIENYDHHLIVSTIGHERRINPYLRTDEEDIIRHLSQKGCDVSSPLSRFASFLHLY